VIPDYAIIPDGEGWRAIGGGWVLLANPDDELGWLYTLILGGTGKEVDYFIFWAGLPDVRIALARARLAMELLRRQ
jgi:hypothetical protein